MPRGKLPTGFGKTLKALYAQGYTSKDAMREAWKIHHGSGPGMTRKPLQRNPKTKFRSRAYIHTQTQANAWTKELDKFNNGQPSYIRDKRQAGIVAAELDRWIAKNPISHKKALRYARELVKHEKAGVKKNPIVVYNPEMRPRIQVSKKSHRGKLRPKSPLKGYRINPRSIVAGAATLPMHNVEIRYQRSTGEYRSEWFKHPFHSTVEILGLQDGSILIRSKSGKKLWGTV